MDKFLEGKFNCLKDEQSVTRERNRYTVDTYSTRSTIIYKYILYTQVLQVPIKTDSDT